MATIEASWQRALRGDFAPLVREWPEASQAHRTSIDALLSLVSRRAPPSIEAALANAAPRALRLLQLRAVLCGDATELEKLSAAQRESGQTEDADLSQRWHAFLTAQRPPSGVKESSDPAGRVEHTTLTALEALAAGDEEEGVKSARRAVRMARAEALVMHELLTSLVFARCRRLEGRPHLATRILASVAAVAPPLWHGWMRYEQALAGELLVEDEEAHHFSAYRTLRDLLSGELASKAPDPESPLHGWAGEELGILAESLDPSRAKEHSPEGWLEGKSTKCPHSILGLCIPEVGDAGEHAPVLLLADPERPLRRVLALSASSLHVAPPDAFTLAQSRTHTAIAYLASEPGLSREALFRRVYGFSFQPERHAGALRVLLHRVRKALPEGVFYEDSALRVERSVLLPDPRIEFQPDTLVLRHLARSAGRASAAQVAEALGVSSRTVQNILRPLLEEGTCTSVRSGRKIEYSLEDTTLSEPTLSRLHPKGLTRF